jgi:hypothetical protein
LDKPNRAGPAQLLIKVCAKVVRKHWENIKEADAIDPVENVDSIREANDFLLQLEEKKYRENQSERIQSLNTPSLRGHRADRSEPSEIGVFFGTVFATTILGAILLGVLYLIYQVLFVVDWLAALREFASSDAIYGVIGMLVFYVLAFRLVAFLDEKGMFRWLFDDHDLVFVGPTSTYRYFESLDEVQADRNFIWHLSKSVGEEPTSAPTQSKDIARDVKYEPPLPAGITEIALKNSNNAVAEMRSDLLRIKSNQERLTQIYTASFAGSVAVALGGLIFLGFEPGLVFGSGGIAALTGAFTFKGMRNLRLAGLAISIFESLVAELADEIDYASQLGERARNNRMQKAWRNFRAGINDLYYLEVDPKTIASDVIESDD